MQLKYPDHITIETTSRCNLKCIMCRGVQDRDAAYLGDIDETVWEKCLEIATHVKLITVYGDGEPLMDPKFLGRLQQLEQTGVQYGFSTNGVLLNQKTIETLIDLKNLKRINISLDSQVPEIYQRIRGAKFENILSNLTTLLQSIKHPDRVSVSAVAMRCNFEKLREFPEFLSKIGCKRFILILLNGDSNFLKQERPPNENFIEVLADIKENCNKFGVTLYFTPSFDTPFAELKDADHATRQCIFPWKSPLITRVGDVLPCCTSRESMGNLRTDTFEDIWTGTKFSNFRAALINGGKNIPEVCKNCTFTTMGIHPYHKHIVKTKFIISDYYSDQKTISNLIRERLWKMTGK